MGIYGNDNSLVIIALSKSICSNLLIYVNKCLKHEIKSIISRSESLAEYRIKNEISQLLFKYKHEHEKQ